MALIIAGERSGVGKTTITLALLSWLKNQGKSVQSFKVGPDYIDPMFHTAVTGLPCRNLDPILTSEDYVRSSFSHHSANAEISIIEGVMGLYDGVPNSNYFAYGSTAHIAKLLKIPVILIIDCSKLSTSIGAIVYGYVNLDREVKIVGIVLNKVGTEKHLSLLKEGLKICSIPIMGIWFREKNIELPSRHLGLIPTAEITFYQDIIQQLTSIAQNNFNWNLLTPYLEEKKSHLDYNLFYFTLKKTGKFRMAIAYDKAFNFYYQDNLDILEKLGIELLFFSPISDQKIPDNIQGIYLGGGFPEIFASELANNNKMKESLKQAINEGIFTYAECGGMMYLSEKIIDFNGKSWEMIGVLPNTAIMSKKLTLGYREAKILIDNKLIKNNEILRGHEFHRAKNLSISNSSILEIKDYYTQQILSYQGWQIKNIYASYLHIHFANYISFIQKLLKQ
ncbi:cobyrinate a,c-diamide synthase [Geminocystis sp. NIES-3709]|uniref:cobyrinate a,c-diamide synthase n=1 Tax=Geminocystis sp. NIES-3709 TaxID=1617448 RepID=UPI0005FC527F|nr:cobyrinate a,c-diamide synthase [Geminocystis sp. NIES-3709]BAQ65424.1 cobyrinic acid A,C-diamide synthase [Geminocystis sp. NIES-3709]